MNIQFGDERYWTTPRQDNRKGFAELQLHRERRGGIEIVAECLFWDAAGRFYIRTSEHEVSVEIAEALIAESKLLVKTK
jgi:hypothetical protein